MWGGCETHRTQRSGLHHRRAGAALTQEAAVARGARRVLTKPPAGERRPGRLNSAAAQLPSPRDTNALTEPRYSGQTTRPARTVAARGRHTCAYRARSRRRRARAPRGAALRGGPGGSARPGTKGPRPPPRHPPGPRPGPYQMELRILCRSALASLPCSPGTRAGRAPAGAGVPASRRGGCPSACCSSAMGARRRRGDAERAGRTRPLPQPSSESPSLAARGTSRAGSRAASRRYAAGWRARLAARRMAARSSSAAPAQGRSALPRFAAPGPARPAPPPPLLAPQPPCPPGRPVRRLGAARAGGPPAGRGLGPGWGGGAAAEGGEWRPPAAALGRPRGAGRGLGRTAGTAKADACARTDARLVRSRA